MAIHSEPHKSAAQATSQALVALAALMITIACAPAKTTTPIQNNPAKNEKPDPNGKLSTEETEKFRKIIVALGRAEQVVRLLDPKGSATWGKTDPAATEMKTQLEANGCKGKLSESEFDSASQKFVTRLETSECRLGTAFMRYEIFHNIEGVSVEGKGTFFFRETLPQTNDVRLATFNWKGTYVTMNEPKDTAPAVRLKPTGTVQFDLKGGGKLKMEIKSSATSQEYRLELKLEGSGFKMPARLIGIIPLPLGKPGTYTLNGTPLEKQDFDDLITKLGWLGGSDIAAMK